MGLLERMQQHRSGKQKSVTGQRIETTLDTLYDAVQRSGEMSLADVSQQFTIPFEEAENLAHTLATEGLIRIDYPVLGQPKLKPMAVETQTAEHAHKARNLIIFGMLIGTVIIAALLLLRQRLQG